MPTGLAIHMKLQDQVILAQLKSHIKTNGALECSHTIMVMAEAMAEGVLMQCSNTELGWITPTSSYNIEQQI